MDKHLDATFVVEVVYATAARQQVITVSVPAGCTILQAAQLSGISHAFPEIDWTSVRLGIYGRLVHADHRVVAGDRVEIYRPLLMDPKESRRQRAYAAKQQRSRNLS